VPYGVAPWQVPVKTTWPHGPDRPGIATAAAVLGFVTGGLTALGSFISLLAILGGTDLPSGLLALGLPCAGGLIFGGVALLRRDSAQALLGSAIASVGVLVVALLAGIASYRGGEAFGFLVFVVLAAVLPIVTGALALSGTVRGWLAAPA
jgi:hypothetical protein